MPRLRITKKANQCNALTERDVHLQYGKLNALTERDVHLQYGKLNALTERDVHLQYGKLIDNIYMTASSTI